MNDARMQAGGYLRLLEHMKGKVESERTAMRLLREAARDARVAGMRQRRKQEKRRRRRKIQAAAGRSYIESENEKKTEEDYAGEKMQLPLRGLESDDRYVTKVIPPDREEPDAPTVGMLPWMD